MARQLRSYLEAQADRVEAILATHRAPARVTGGTVGPRLIRFFVNPAPHTRFATIKKLADDLALALRVPNLQVQRGQEGIVLAFANPEPRPVDLLTLLPDVLPLPSTTVLLGLSDEGAPLLARLASPEVTHILVAGTTGSGKSALLRTIAASIILGHTPDAMRLVCIDPKGHAFREIQGAPHLTRAPVTGANEAQEALHSLVRVMEARDRRGETPGEPHGPNLNTPPPRIVVLLDEVADLMMLGGMTISEPLTRLLQRGRQAGIHIIAATQRPSAAVLSGLMRANFPLRLVGRVVSANDARVASGRAATHAHTLNGRGDFLAVGSQEFPIRFQVAYISAGELHNALPSATAKA